MAQALPQREDVPENRTWDLTTIFPSDADWQKAFDDVTASISSITAVQGTLGESPAKLISGVNQILSVFRALEKVYVYSTMKSDQDTANSTYQGMKAKASALAVKVESAAAFSDPEILAIPAATLQQWLRDDKDLQPFAQFLKNITIKRDHTLDAKTEALLASAGDALNASAATFNQLNNSDIEFGMVADEDGNFVQLSHGIYGEMIRSTKQEVRQDAFDTMYEAYDGLLNTFAATLSGQVKANNFSALAHNYPNARAAAMAHSNIPEVVYSTLIDQVHAHLPLLHRYVALRKQILGLDELHSYDLYVPITGKAPLSYTIDEAKAEGEKALASLGSDYLQHVRHIFNDRIIDFVENKNKRSGAYSGGSYDTDAFILHNWHDSLDALYTLVHETGHSVHSEYTRGNQPYMYGDYPIFVAEIASTSNEALLTDYLLKTQTDPKVRAYILNYDLDGFKGTLFRQTQFAEFEHWIHQQDQAGQPLTADTMSDFYGDLNAKYYGPALERDDAISLEWARIPHFYYNYYVYQYATGFAAANALTSHIIDGTDGAVAKYLGFLKSGSSKFAIDTMKDAGVDMTQAAYLEDAFKVFEARLDEFEALINNK
jgi:oligoendopeptidase F